MVGKTVHVSGFPFGVEAESVKNFLELYTGQGTVYACKVRSPKDVTRSARVFAIVQFTESVHAERINRLALGRKFYYGSSWLGVRNLDRDIIPQPRVPVFEIEEAVLHLGCLVSKETYESLFSNSGVKVEFGFGLHKISFFLTWGSSEYRLDLHYSYVWQIQLRHGGGMNKKYLLFQIQSAPRIFEKPVASPFSSTGCLNLEFYKVLPDSQWFRTTDFTPSCSIGQSSALCLELPSASSSLPNIRDYFAHFKSIEGNFTLQRGVSYSHSLHLVPIVKPPPRINVPFKILFKTNHLLHNGYLVGPTLTDEFYQLLCPSPQRPLHHIELALEKLSQLRDCCFEPVKWLKGKFAEFDRRRHVPNSVSISLEPGLVYVHRVQVTPSKVYFYGPEISVSNHVIRQYPDEIDNFLRISFIDEDYEKIHSTDLSRRTRLGDEDHTSIYERVLLTLEKGLMIGDKTFEFLAFSSSQLRENSLWMFASNSQVNAAGIRRRMGDFSSIRNVAKFAARLGQSFSSSTETLNVYPYEVAKIPDVLHGKYTFSDGIGKISFAFARKVAEKCRCTTTPSAFQIRYGGYKGVVSVDPTSNFKLSLRDSMRKYESSDTQMNVLAWSKYLPCHLNRQIITLLSTLGVKDYIFEHKQKEAIDQLDRILEETEAAFTALEQMPQNENSKLLVEMLNCGYKPDSEPFLSMMLKTYRATKLAQIRRKARIFVADGRTMMGCLDETGTLEYGQVFVQISAAGENQCNKIVQGVVVVAKNPCLHPGDVRVLRATNVPALYHMVDCVVFPQKGRRPHPNECSGSDLDGDLYFVTWDEALIPPRQIPPMDYDPAPAMELDRHVSIKDVQEYFAKYMINDSLGVISNAHTVFADKEVGKAESNPCIELAKLFSIAVDFPKTGIPASIPYELRVQEYPDFMEKPDKPTFESKGIIGKLFRAIKDKSYGDTGLFTADVARKAYDPDMEIEGFEAYLEDAYLYKGEYDMKLGNLMQHYGFKTEAEMLCGNAMTGSGSIKRNRDAEAIHLAVRSLRKEARGWFADDNEDDMYAKASAWYHVTYHRDYWGAFSEGNQPHLISFPWCVYDKLITIKKDKMRFRRMRTAQLTRKLQSFSLN